MNQAARTLPTEAPLMADLLPRCEEAAEAAAALLSVAQSKLGNRLSSEDGRISNKALEADQSAAHALAWIATYVESLKEMLGWAKKLDAEGKLGEMESLILQIAFGEYLWQLYGGIPMSQGRDRPPPGRRSHPGRPEDPHAACGRGAHGRWATPMPRASGSWI